MKTSFLPFNYCFLFLASMLLVSCNCSQSYMPKIKIVYPSDKYLNCEQLVFRISEAKYMMKNVLERCGRPHVFAHYLPCTPMVKMDAARNEYIINDRIQYLESLMKIKNCYNGKDISKQSYDTSPTSVSIPSNSSIMPYGSEIR